MLGLSAVAETPIAAIAIANAALNLLVATQAHQAQCAAAPAIAQLAGKATAHQAQRENATLIRIALAEARAAQAQTEAAPAVRLASANLSGRQTAYAAMTAAIMRAVAALAAQAVNANAPAQALRALSLAAPQAVHAAGAAIGLRAGAAGWFALQTAQAPATLVLGGAVLQAALNAVSASPMLAQAIVLRAALLRSPQSAAGAANARANISGAMAAAQIATLAPVLTRRLSLAALWPQASRVAAELTLNLPPSFSIELSLGPTLGGVTLRDSATGLALAPVAASVTLQQPAGATLTLGSVSAQRTVSIP